jgi:hypothetical protein
VLIVANGAFKCGSGWQHQILRRLVPSERIPEEFQNPKWRNPSFDPDRLPTFLPQKHHVKRDFVSKNHIRRSPVARLLLDDPYVLVCTLTRDIRDVLVSAYHHDRRLGRTDTEDIEEYYWKMGRQRIDAVLSHHRFWNVGHGGVFVGSYERLHADFDAEVRSLAAFIGVELEDRKLERIREETAFDKAKKTGPGTHRRKGVVGDWQGTLSPAVLEDLGQRVAGVSEAPGEADSRAPAPVA